MLVSAMSVALVSNKKAQERIIIIDKSLKLKPTLPAPLWPAPPVTAPAPAPAPALPGPHGSAIEQHRLSMIAEEEGPYEPIEDMVRPADIADFLLWKAHNSSPPIFLPHNITLATARASSGGPLSVIKDLNKLGWPLNWPSVEVLADWSKWLRNKIDCAPAPREQDKTNPEAVHPGRFL